jgi:hypothetical protein
MALKYCVHNGNIIEAVAGRYTDRVQAEADVIARGYEGLVPAREQLALIRDLKSGKLLSEVARRTAENMVAVRAEHCSDFFIATSTILVHIPRARSVRTSSGRIEPDLSGVVEPYVLPLTDGGRTLKLGEWNDWNPDHVVFRRLWGEEFSPYEPELFIREGSWPVGRGISNGFSLYANYYLIETSRGFVSVKKNSP